MNLAGKFLGENIVDHAMSFHTALSGEDIGPDPDFEMGLSALTPARMAGMVMADIKHLDLAR